MSIQGDLAVMEWGPGKRASGWVLMSAVVSAEDREDIAESLSGSEAAYSRLVTRYQGTIASQMWRFSRDPRIIEELVQEAFVQAYLSLPKFKGRSPFLHWLRAIATRVGYRHWRSKKRDQERRDALHALGSVVLPKDAGPSEAGEYLHTLLATLAPEDRLVLTLHYFEGCDTLEIAERMGWSRSLVKVRAYRARKKLRAMLEEAGYGRAEA